MPWELSDEYRAENWPPEPRLTEIRQQKAAEVKAYMDSLAPLNKYAVLDTFKIMADKTFNTESEQITEEAIVNWCKDNTCATFDIDKENYSDDELWWKVIVDLATERQGMVYALEVYDDCHPERMSCWQLFFEYDDDAILVKMSL